MEITAYLIRGQNLYIRPAPLERDWMEETDSKYAYRCLPLNIANCFGWEILCQEGFIATWMGGKKIADLIVQHDSQHHVQAESHFGSGILTFHVGAIFRTDPNVSLLATGPINSPKDGIAPLTGVIETDWAPYTFTMNWKFTRPGTIRFYKGEPFCHIMPVSCSNLENVNPKIAPLESNQELHEQYTTWSRSRGNFIKGLAQGDKEIVSQKWQKLYYRGLDATSCPAHTDKHRTKIKLKDFKEI